MKRFRVVFSALLILTLVGGLFYRSYNRVQVTEKTEFLFDTYCTVTVYSRNADQAVDAVFEEMRKIHKLTDFFDEDSEVSKINKTAKTQAVPVSDEVLQILKTANEIKDKSDGAFDVCVAPLSVLWKFDAANAQLPKPELIQERLAKVRESGLNLDLKSKTVTKQTDETTIDLGGAAKGYAGDAAVRILHNYGIKSAIVDLGGNIICIGENPTTKDKKWHIGLQKPFAATGEYSRVIEVTSGAVVTSGIYQRYFEKDGRIYHHIIDPRSGYPKEQKFKSVTVTADNSLIADCIATAVYVLGQDKGEKLAEEYGAELYFSD